MKRDDTLIWAIVGIVVVLFFSGFGTLGLSNSGFGGMRLMMYGLYGSGMMFFSWLYGTLVLIALILFIFWLIKQIQTPHRRR